MRGAWYQGLPPCHRPPRRLRKRVWSFSPHPRRRPGHGHHHGSRSLHPRSPLQQTRRLPFRKWVVTVAHQPRRTNNSANPSLSVRGGFPPRPSHLAPPSLDNAFVQYTKAGRGFFHLSLQKTHSEISLFKLNPYLCPRTSTQSNPFKQMFIPIFIPSTYKQPDNQNSIVF